MKKLVALMMGIAMSGLVWGKSLIEVGDEYYAMGTAYGYHQAFNYYQQAAEQGNAEAQTKISQAYYHGEGVQQDYQSAFSWATKAADQDFADAQLGLGLMYKNGLGVKQDYYQAVQWYKRPPIKDMHPLNTILV